MSAFEEAWTDFKFDSQAVPASWDTSREAFAAGWRLGIEYACKQIAWDVQDQAGVPAPENAGLSPQRSASDANQS